MKIFIAFVYLLIFFPESGNQQPFKLHSFKWMIGEWHLKTKKGQMVESWELKNDSTFIGKSFMLKADGSKHILENIELVYRMNEVFYIPSVENQNNRQPVKFKLLNYNANSFAAVNNEHDYPKRISYRLIGKDSLHAKIDDGRDAPVKFSNFHFTRKNKS
jgi:hypothetical protein